MTDANAPLIDYIRELSNRKFWGSVTLKFQDGGVIHVVEERSFKPEQLVPDHRRKHGTEND